MSAETVDVLKHIAKQLQMAGAVIPPRNAGSIESAMATGLSIALLLVFEAIEQNDGTVDYPGWHE